MKTVYRAILIALVASLAACATPGNRTSQAPNDASAASTASEWQGGQPFCCSSSAS